jgi:hypothetical protein
MALTFGMSTVRDLFAKLQRDASLLEEEVTSDRLFNFVITGYSIIDWVRNDPSVPSTAKSRLVIESLRRDRQLEICGDLANGCKHFVLTQRKPITSLAPSTSGFGVGRYGIGPTEPARSPLKFS